MEANFSGVILEEQEYKLKTGELKKLVRMFQEGNKQLVEIKNIPIEENLKVGVNTTVKARIQPWAYNGKVGLTCYYVEGGVY